MLLKIAWRNIWRSPVRSWIIIAALTVGMFAGIFSATFINGWMMQRLHDGVETETGHIQIFRDGYRKHPEVDRYFNARLDSVVVENPKVQGVSSRLMVQGMAASSETARGVKVYGVDADAEKAVLNLHEKIIDGNWFESPYKRPIIMGEKLAKQLQLKLKSRIILRFQDVEGNITGGAFRVAGIFKTNNAAFDGSNVWVKKESLAQLLGISSDNCHSMVVRLVDADGAIKVAGELQKQLSDEEVVPWKELSPELGYMTELGNTYLYLFVIIILLALGFGIINTMLMVVLERVREIGMLMSVGMSRRRIFFMIMVETVMLSSAGGLSGIFLGMVAVWRLSITGIDLSVWSTGLTEMGFDPIVYPEWDAALVFNIAMLVVLTGILASLYPAWKALKLKPSEAVRVI
ncbi:ABC transporter permease [Thermophagus sp. OGC60D27]|uniref:ABC transporter permease n=1 Tax=Thermophagus sp. OGC60D27 TaxID=3458415 RepID=UPI004037A98C